MFLNPIPGSTRQKSDGEYSSDSGLDILTPYGTPVHAPASGWIVYSEHGHTPWVPCPEHPKDTPNSVLMVLDQPIEVDGKKYAWVWCTHISRLAHQVHEGDGQHVRVNAGDIIGWTGIGRSIEHLHIGIICGRAQASEQDWLAPHLVAGLVWPAGSHPVLGAPPQEPHLRILVEQPQGSPMEVFCHPKMEDGFIRADIRSLLQAAGLTVDATGLAASGQVVVRRKP